VVRGKIIKKDPGGRIGGSGRERDFGTEPDNMTERPKSRPVSKDLRVLRIHLFGDEGTRTGGGDAKAGLSKISAEGAMTKQAFWMKRRPSQGAGRIDVVT